MPRTSSSSRRRDQGRRARERTGPPDGGAGERRQRRAARARKDRLRIAVRPAGAHRPRLRGRRGHAVATSTCAVPIAGARRTPCEDQRFETALLAVGAAPGDRGPRWRRRRARRFVLEERREPARRRRQSTGARRGRRSSDAAQAGGPAEADAAGDDGARGGPRPRSKPRQLLTVPDFKGKRLSVAMREARKLGLDVAGTARTANAVPRRRKPPAIACAAC